MWIFKPSQVCISAQHFYLIFAFLPQITALTPDTFFFFLGSQSISPTTSASQKLLCKSFFFFPSTRGKLILRAPSKEVPEFPVSSAPCSSPLPAFDPRMYRCLRLNPTAALCDCTTLGPWSMGHHHCQCLVPTGPTMLMSSGKTQLKTSVVHDENKSCFSLCSKENRWLRFRSKEDQVQPSMNLLVM